MTPTDRVVTSEMVANRKRLAALVAEAASIEHAVMCLYLFVAASMKTSVAEGGVTLAQLERMRVWRAHIMKVARQEMEHLGIALNLLTAIGEAPLLRHPPFPFTSSFGANSQRFSLERFGVESMVAFALLETPQNLQPGSPAWQLLAKYEPQFQPGNYDLIAKIYDEVETLITAIPDEVLFIGPPSAQFVNDSLMPLTIRGVSIAGQPNYNVNLNAITDRKSALAGVNQIKEEGEGAHLEGGPHSHFHVFAGILAELDAMADPAFVPARPVVANPTLTGTGPGVITHPSTRQVMALFDMSYETLVTMLARYFACTDETPDDEYALERAAFLPMMTTVIRPLGEILTCLPAYEDASMAARAGATFRLPSTMDFLPHRSSAFTLIGQNLTQMTETARQVSDLASAPDAPPFLAAQADRLLQAYETIWRIGENMRTGWVRQPS